MPTQLIRNTHFSQDFPWQFDHSHSWARALHRLPQIWLPPDMEVMSYYGFFEQSPVRGFFASIHLKCAFRGYFKTHFFGEVILLRKNIELLFEQIFTEGVVGRVAWRSLMHLPNFLCGNQFHRFRRKWMAFFMCGCNHRVLKRNSNRVSCRRITQCKFEIIQNIWSEPEFWPVHQLEPGNVVLDIWILWSLPHRWNLEGRFGMGHPFKIISDRIMMLGPYWMVCYTLVVGR